MMTQPDVRNGASASLTPKQRAFTNEYIIDLNGTQAAIRAGYSAQTATAIAHENLRKPHIAAAIQEAFAERAERTEINADWVIKGLVENFYRAMQATEVLDRKGKPSGEWKYDGAVANRALELLGKHLGMFVNRIEHSGVVNRPWEQLRAVSDEDLETIAEEYNARAIAIRERNAKANAIEGEARMLESDPDADDASGQGGTAGLGD